MYGHRCFKQKEIKEDSTTFLTAFKWALQNYKQEIEGFELWNIISKTVIIVGSTIMYKDNRFATHITVMSWSLLLHIRFRPFKDRDSNICAILFCSCDILGAMSARYTSAGLQIMFIICTLITIFITGRFMYIAITKQTASLRSELSSQQNTNDIFAMYTPLEKKLLCPVLAVVWVCVKLFSKYCGSDNSEMHKTKVVPETKNMEQETDEAKTDPVLPPRKELEKIRAWNFDELEKLSKHLKKYKKVFKDCGKFIGVFFVLFLIIILIFYTFFADISGLSFIHI